MLPFRGWPVQPFRTQPFSIGGFPCQAFSTVNPKEPDVASTAGEVIPKKEADEVCQLALRVADRILRLVKGLLDIDQYRVGTMAGEAMSGKAQSRVAEGGRISQPRSVKLGKVLMECLIVEIQSELAEGIFGKPQEVPTHCSSHHLA